MSAVRCGLDLDHEEHEHLLGRCDGKAADLPGLAPGEPLAKLFIVSALPRPWSWSTLTVSQAAELRELLDAFAAHYNDTYAVRDGELLLACWPLHPGLAHELAALYGLWVHLFQSGLAPASEVAVWYERWLPGFRARMPYWYGVGPDTCTPGTHREDWNQAARKVGAAAKSGLDASVFEGQVEDALRRYTSNPGHLDTGD